VEIPEKDAKLKVLKVVRKQKNWGTNKKRKRSLSI